MTATGLEAFVLIGGFSERMGEDKASLRIGGERMAERVAAALRAHAVSVRFVGKHRPEWIDVADFVSDGTEEKHALHGVRAAMEAACGSWVLIAPCDLAGLLETHVGTLLDSVGPVIATGAAGDQPLLARLPTSWLSRVRSWIVEGAPARRLGDEAEAIPLPDSALRNINLPVDLDRFVRAGDGERTEE
jgi:molybdopterin-guanine dinucleotide biosynthesis protein A